MLRLLFIVAALLARSLCAQTAEIEAKVTNDKGQPIADAVVVAVPVDGTLRPPKGLRENVIDQVDKEFHPQVLVVLVGTPVTFPNNDNVRHHVYSFSPAKRFELPLYAGVPAQPVVFDKAGVVVLGCNIHDWMVGYVYVSESPHFVKTGNDGKAVLTGLPPKSYLVRVWHPQLIVAEETTQKTVDASSTHRANVAWTLQLGTGSRVRRAPTADHASHY